MAGLLGNGFEDPKSAAIMALAGGLLQGNFGAGLLGANAAYGNSKNDALKRQLVEAQMQETLAQAQERAMHVKQAEMKQQEAARIRTLIGNAGRPAPGMGATNLVNDALPQEMQIGAQPQIGQPGIDYQSLFQQGAPFETLKQLADTRNLGQAEVARTVNVPGPNGEKMLQQMDKFGRPVGKPVSEFEAAQMIQLGDRQIAAVPRAGMSFQMGMSPEAKDSSARGWAGLAETKRHNGTVEGNASALLSKPFEITGPNGVPILVQQDRQGNIKPVDGFQPKGMGATKLTEDQGKATGWLVQAENAWKNMQAAGMKDGKVTSAAYPGINDALETVPGLAPLANSMRGADRQKFMQASSSLSESLLRAATGAGVNRDEAVQKIKELTPVFGEDPANTKQKFDAIPLYIESLKVRAGPGAAKAAEISANGAKADFKYVNGKLVKVN